MKILVLGATGSFGGAVAEALAARGHELRLLTRNPAKAEVWRRKGCETVPGDAEDADAVTRAAEQCEAIVHGINYPYQLWHPHMLRVTDNVIAAAKEAGALIVFPGNVYGLGRQTGRPLPEDAPNRPDTVKGRLRVDMEDRLRAATQRDARVLVVRAGDYYGPTARNGMVDRIFGHAAQGKPLQVFGRLDIPHQWAYLPDLGRLAAALVERDDLRPFEVVNFAGHLLPTQRDFMRLVAREADHPDLPVRRVPWTVVRLMGVFNPILKELMELRYLFDEAVILDDPRRHELLPGFQTTPVEQAVRATIDSYRV